MEPFSDSRERRTAPGDHARLKLDLATDCTEGERLTPIDAAFRYFAELPEIVGETESVPVQAAVGRVLAEDVATAMPLPPFDHSAVDGFGLSASDFDRAPPIRLRLAGRLAAGDEATLPLQAGEAVQLLTGAAIPPGVRGIVLEERCQRTGSLVCVNVPVPEGANIRRRGEDVPEGACIVEAPAILDARHAAILVAAGVRRVAVRRKIRVAAFSNGNELCDLGASLVPGRIHDANRPMLLSLLASPWTEAIDAGRHPDDPAALTALFARLAPDVDVVIGSGGVAGSDADHVASAIAAARGTVRRFRLALRPGKPILGGRIGGTAMVGLPGNPVAALVNFMLFGRAVLSAAAGLAVRRPRGQAAVTVGDYRHAAGRTEFVPVRVVDVDDIGRPLVEKLGRGGSARLRPLVLADGLAEIPDDRADLDEGSPVAFHAFKAAFAP
jgi:molybdopterin molybdotransferase